MKAGSKIMVYYIFSLLKLNLLDVNSNILDMYNRVYLGIIQV